MTTSHFGNVKNEAASSQGNLPFLTGGTSGRPNRYLLEIDLAKTFPSAQDSRVFSVIEFTVLEVLSDGGSIARNPESSKADERQAAPATKPGTRANYMVVMGGKSSLGDLKAAVSAILDMDPEDIDAGTMETAFRILDQDYKAVNAPGKGRKIRDADGVEYSVEYDEDLLRGSVVECSVYEKVQRRDNSKTFTKHVWSPASGD